MNTDPRYRDREVSIDHDLDHRLHVVACDRCGVSFADSHLLAEHRAGGDCADPAEDPGLARAQLPHERVVWYRIGDAPEYLRWAV